MVTLAVDSRRAPIGTPARSTLLWVLACALLVAGSTFLPYLHGYLTTPAGMQFQGVLVLPQDLFGYLAKMQLGARGEWLFRLAYTSEDHDGALLSVFYLALGRLSAVFGLPLIVTFHLARLATGVFLLTTVFYVALAVFKKARLAWGCFAVAALSSGFGWLTTLFGHLPSDMLIPESVTYYAIFDNPHFPLSMGLLLLTFLALLKAIEQRRRRYAVMAGLLTLVQTFIQPFLVITVYAVAVCWMVWRWSCSKRISREEAVYLGWVAGLPLPGLANDYVALYLNPVLRQWSAQNLTPSPPPYDFLLGYGLVALLAALGVAHLWRSEKPLLVSAECRQLLLVWVAVTLILLYVPFSFQRRLSAGLHLSLSFLAVIGYYGYLARRRFPGMGSVLILAMLPSNLFLVVFTAVGAASYPYPLYLRDGEVGALRWLDNNATVFDTVLASESTGNIVPALAGNRVFYGYPFETIRAEEKRALLARFFAGEMGEGEEKLFLAGYGIRLVYYGRSERGLGAFSPASRPYLEAVFENGDVAIYRVEP